MQLPLHHEQQSTCMLLVQAIVSVVYMVVARNDTHLSLHQRLQPST